MGQNHPLKPSRTKRVLVCLAAAIAAAPVAAVLTVLFWPFWGWIEAKFGIESVGHSGPADWCFLAVYFFVLIASFATWFLTRPKGSTSRRTS